MKYRVVGYFNITPINLDYATYEEAKTKKKELEEEANYSKAEAGIYRMFCFLTIVTDNQGFWQEVKE
jgi:hypothetical protein